VAQSEVRKVSLQVYPRLKPAAADQDPDRAALGETAAMLFWALLASGQITMTAPVGKTINTLLGAPSLILPGEETKQ
jgi:hypothetical protein